MSSFVFNDLIPVEGEFKVRAIDFIGRGVSLYDYQRHENPQRVKEIVDEQNSHKKLLFATSFVIAHIEGVHKLCDGQHRLSALRQLLKHPDIDALEIHVIVHLCGNDNELAQRIYLQCNNQYLQNASIDRTRNEVIENKEYREIVEIIKRKYPKQIGRNYFPYFDPNQLETQLLKTQVLDKFSKEAFMKRFFEMNEKYGETLKKEKVSAYNRCVEKNGFFLVAKSPACRWISELL